VIILLNDFFEEYQDPKFYLEGYHLRNFKLISFFYFFKKIFQINLNHAFFQTYHIVLLYLQANVLAQEI